MKWSFFEDGGGDGETDSRDACESAHGPSQGEGRIGLTHRWKGGGGGGWARGDGRLMKFAAAD